MIPRPTRHNRARLVRVLFATLTGLALVVGPMVPAQAAVTSISGTITGPSGQLLSGVYVTVVDPDGNGDGTITNSVGQFSIPVNDNRRYTLVASDLENTWATQYWGNKVSFEEATFFDVGPGGRNDLNMTLAQNTTISGTVSERLTPTEKVEGVEVVSSVSDGQGGWYLVSRATTDELGTYLLYVPAGRQYRIQFEHPEYATQYYDDKYGEQAPTLVPMTSAHRSGVDAKLDERPKISGTVTSLAGSGITGVNVDAYQLRSGTWESVYSTTTGAAGKYEVEVQPGTYRIGFSAQGYDPEYWNDKETVTAATSIQVTNVASPGHNAVLELTPAPSISGTAQVGRTLTAVAGTWRSDVSLTYQWRHGSTDIPGATGSSYAVTADDVDSRISVVVTGTRPGSSPRSIVSPQTAPAVLGQLTAGTPSIGGTATIGSTLTASPGVWGPSGVTVAYQWFRNGTTAIFGATGSSYEVTVDDAGSQITVRATGTKAGYQTTFRTSSASATVPPPPPITVVQTPRITGTAKVGQTLTATSGTWTPSDVTVTYQWRRGDLAIANATSSTYEPVAADVGKVLTVRVTAARTGYAGSSADSAATSAVTAADPTPTTPTPTTPTPTTPSPTPTTPTTPTPTTPSPTTPSPTPTTPTTPAPVVKKVPTVRIATKVKSRKPTFTVVVTSPGLVSTGVVTIKLNGKAVRNVALTGQRAIVTLPKQKKGTKTFTVVYNGNTTLLSRIVVTRVKIK